jgi:hypothetical protein
MQKIQFIETNDFFVVQQGKMLEVGDIKTYLNKVI